MHLYIAVYLIYMHVYRELHTYKNTQHLWLQPVNMLEQG